MRKDSHSSKAPLFITTGRVIDKEFGSLSARVMNQRGSQALGPNVIAVSIDDFSRAKQARIAQLSSEMGDSMLVGTKANLNVAQKGSTAGNPCDNSNGNSIPAAHAFNQQYHM